MTWLKASELLKRTKEEGMRRNQITLVAGGFGTHVQKQKKREKAHGTNGHVLTRTAS